MLPPRLLWWLCLRAMLLPSGDASALAEEPLVDSVVASGNVEEVPVSQACQSVLDEVVVAPPVLEVISASSQGPLGDVRGNMDLDSLNLHDNELNEVASQPMVLSGKPLFDGGSESASGGAPAGATLVSAEETSELVKSLKAVLPVSAEPAVGGDTWGSSGDPSHEFVVPLLPHVRQQSSSARVASRSRSRYGDESLHLLVRLALRDLVILASHLVLLGLVRQLLSCLIFVSFFAFCTRYGFFQFFVFTYGSFCNCG